jgi:hypothetical protein
LDNALDLGLTEAQFWEMSVAELDRYFESRKRVEQKEAKERAYFDYILADLIGRSVSRVYSNQAKLPELYEVYPTLFDNQEAEQQRQEKLAELSALRFKQYANFHNKKFN